ncbi:MAG: ATP-dependent DNA helicase RecG, partial [Oscillospiraceae bacterium]|nr:ATP-dependent DNA helicase RecG [Oscillospiraceae bacterium]
TRVRKGLEISKAAVLDESGTLDVVFFNRSYVRNALLPGRRYIFYGKIEGTSHRREMSNPIFERADAPRLLTGRIVPIYRLTAGITSSMLSRAIREALNALKDSIPDCLPAQVRHSYQLAHARFAYETIHFPPSLDALEIAKRRLVFEELFVFSSGLSLLKKQRSAKKGRALSPVSLEPFYKALPFSLTNAQRRAISEAASDLSTPVPMNRLVQGDVGSGKTMVAAALIYLAAKNGVQSALMAPTELLARQHQQTLHTLMGNLGVRTGLLTASLPAKARRTVLERTAKGEIDLLIGTHALISQGVDFFRLGLVITDEQHRFGVHQRGALTAKGENPHVLVMSATPIPRTLALILYGDLDISILDELPPGRKKVDTFVIGENKRQALYGFVRKLAAEGRQTYIVCPLVEEGEKTAEAKAVTEYAGRLRREVFPDLRVSFVHGRMSALEKGKLMNAFSAGDIDILVSTTVIEVGVDVPNAALMVVENADRFGLSQLHQLRGRVGRGVHKSYCILLSSSNSGEAAARFSALCKTSDGFKISEEDLKLRGPGDFFGSRQHGLPNLKIADLTCNMKVLAQAQEATAQILSQDPSLSLPEHQALTRRIDLLFGQAKNSFN